MITAAFLGNFSVPYCSENYYKEELESLGINVLTLQETEVTGHHILETAKKSNLFIWVHSHGFKMPTDISIDSILDHLREFGIPTMAYHLDVYMPIPERWAEYENSTYFRGLDHFFTVDKLMADWLNENTRTKGHFLPAGIPSSQCYIEDYDPEFASEVVFVGSRRYHPIWPYRGQLLDFLTNTYGTRFTHWGGDGKALVRQDRMNKAYASCKVAVADVLCKDFTYPDYASDRLFNQLGAGAFTIHPYVKGIENFYEIDKELVTYEFGNFGQLKEKIDYFLSNPAKRNDIRIAGYLRTKKEHTYRDRWKTILKTIGLL